MIKIWSVSILILLAACSQKSETCDQNPNSATCSPKEAVACNADTSKSLIKKIMKDNLIKEITADLADQTAISSAIIDAASIRASVEKVSFGIEDVLTTKSDPSSTKKFCAASLHIVLPSNVIADSDAVRVSLALASTHQDALKLGIDFDADTLKGPFSYNVQPTDDGEKVYGSVDSDVTPLSFASTLIQQSLLKGAIEQSKAAQDQQRQTQALQEQQRQAEIDQAQASTLDATLKKAQADMKASNDRLNVVWNAGSKEWRQAMLPEQRLWLTKRENDCKLKALDSGVSGSATFETNKIACQVAVTSTRTDELTASVQQSLSAPGTQ